MKIQKNKTNVATNKYKRLIIGAICIVIIFGLFVLVKYIFYIRSDTFTVIEDENNYCGNGMTLVEPHEVTKTMTKDEYNKAQDEGRCVYRK